MARNVKDKNFTGEKDHENLRSYIPEADDTNDDKILKAVARKPNAFFFTNDNNLYTKVFVETVGNSWKPEFRHVCRGRVHRDRSSGICWRKC